MPGLEPVPGDRYKNRHRDLYGVVVAVQKRRRTWVLFRWNNREEEMSLQEFQEFWRPV